MKKIYQLVIGLMLAFALPTYAQEGYQQYQQGKYQEAYDRAKPLAEKGNADAQYLLGMLYQKEEFQKNDPDSIKWLTLAAQQKNTMAMGMLATLLFGTEPTDMVMAYVWSNLAARYDAIQAGTSARRLIEMYLSEDEKKAGDKKLKEYIQQFDKK